MAAIRRELIRIAEPTRFDTYIAMKRGASLSLHVEHFIECLRSEMRAIDQAETAPRRRCLASKKNNMVLCLRHIWVIELSRGNALSFARLSDTSAAICAVRQSIVSKHRPSSCRNFSAD